MSSIISVLYMYIYISNEAMENGPVTDVSVQARVLCVFDYYMRPHARNVLVAMFSPSVDDT